MMISAGRLGLSILCAIGLWGCGIGFDPPDPPQTVQTISMADAAKCRLITPVAGVGYTGPEEDGQLSARHAVESQVTLKGGNALVITSVSSQTLSDPNKPTQVTVSGNAYLCDWTK